MIAIQTIFLWYLELLHPTDEIDEAPYIDPFELAKVSETLDCCKTLPRLRIEIAVVAGDSG